MRRIARGLIERGGNQSLDLASPTLRGAPGRGSSSKPSRRRATNRLRHLPTVCGVIRSERHLAVGRALRTPTRCARAAPGPARSCPGASIRSVGCSLARSASDPQVLDPLAYSPPRPTPYSETKEACKTFNELKTQDTRARRRCRSSSWKSSPTSGRSATSSRSRTASPATISSPKGKAKRATPKPTWRSSKSAGPSWRRRRTDVAGERAGRAPAKLEGLMIQVTQKAGVDGRLFGSVTNFDISEALKAQGHDVAKAPGAPAARPAQARWRLRRRARSARRREGDDQGFGAGGAVRAGARD